MSEVDAQFEKYKKDPRIPCRYGGKCYQRNSAHIDKYKHPPKNGKRKYINKLEPAKRIKVDESAGSKNEDDSNDGQDSPVTEVDETPNPPTRKECISPSESESSDSSHKKGESPVDELIICSTEDQDEKQENDNGKEESVSQDTKEEELPEKILNKSFDPKKFIKSRFLLDLPSDFYDFWEVCKELNAAHPGDALKEVGLKLVGPFDVLAGKFKHVKKSPDEYLRHWRYYYDPPEVLTVIKGDDRTGYHIGYFYDSPEEARPFLVSNYGTKDGVFTQLGDNIFAAVCFYLEEQKKIGDPFKKMNVGKLLTCVKSKAEKLKLNISIHSQPMKDRSRKVVAKTYNKIGLVVPYNKKTQLGYRELAMEDKELMILLTKLEKASPEQKSKYLSDLQPVLTYANIALDECDFGTGVKLGWELLYHGIDSLNATISRFLSNSYRLLNKEVFAKIAEAHMKDRKKGCNLSIVH